MKIPGHFSVKLNRGGQGLAQPGFQLKDSLFEAKLAEACRVRHGGLLPM